MKRACVLASLAAAGLFAQAPRPVSAVNTLPTGLPSRSAPVSLATLTTLEKSFDTQLGSLNPPDHVDLLGTTRGLYLDGYGAVFTTEAALVFAPPISPFHPAITPQERAKVHQRKVEQLPRLRDALKEMVRSAAGTLAQLPEDQQVVMAVRLLYMPWEDSSGLPGLVIAKADRRAALTGDVKIQELR